MIGGLAIGGCGPCGRLDYDTGLAIAIDNTPGPGSYRLDLHADGQRLTIDYAVSDDATVSCVAGCEAEAGNFRLATSSFWGDLSGLSVDSLHFEVRRLDEPQRGPDHLEVLVLRDQVVMFDDTFAIEYSTDEPNGEGCGERTVANIRVDLAR